MDYRYPIDLRESGLTLRDLFKCSRDYPEVSTYPECLAFLKQGQSCFQYLKEAVPVLMIVDPAIMLMVKLVPALTFLVTSMLFKPNKIYALASTVAVAKSSMVTESPSAVHVTALFPGDEVFVLWFPLVVVVTIAHILTVQPSVSKVEGKST